MVKGKPVIVRTSVSLPAGLKRRMDKVKEPVNWSALACRAFENELADIASRKEKKDMSGVIDRLRSSLRGNEDEVYKKGFAFGQWWASHRAEASFLQRLERLHERLEYDTSYGWQGFFDSDFGQGQNVSWNLASELLADNEPHQDEVRDFWEVVTGERDDRRIEDDGWLRGFADGAIDVWVDVKSQL